METVLKDVQDSIASLLNIIIDNTEVDFSPWEEMNEIFLNNWMEQLNTEADDLRVRAQEYIEEQNRMRDFDGEIINEVFKSETPEPLAENNDTRTRS